MTVPPPLPAGVPVIEPVDDTPVPVQIAGDIQPSRYGQHLLKYKPEYCEQVVAIMSEGVSLTGFAGRIGVCRKTVWEWSKKYPEFADALDRGKEASALFWEQELIRVSKAGTNTSAAIFALKNRGADDWKDKQEIETRNYNLNVELTRDDRIKSIEGKLARIIEHDETETVS